MRPNNLEDYLFIKLMQSQAFHRFVRNIYYKVNGIDPRTINQHQSGPRFPAADPLFQPTPAHKFKAFRLMFYDEMRASFGLTRKYEK